MSILSPLPLSPDSPSTVFGDTFLGSPQPGRSPALPDAHGGHIDSLRTIGAGQVPSSLLEMLIELGKRQEALIAKIADAVRQGDTETVFRLAVELTRVSPPDAIK